MPESDAVLLIANRTAASTQLCEIVRRLAARSAVRFHVIVPATPRGLHRVVDPEVTGRDEARTALEAAFGPLSEAAGCDVSGEVGDADPLAAIQDALGRGEFDEIVVSTLPRRLSRWLHLDLPSKARGLGLPVTHVEAWDVREPALAGRAA